jgi:hypothetical protein
MSSISFNDSREKVFDLNRHNFNNDKSDFRNKSNNISGLSKGDDILFNKKYISDDIVASSSASSSCGSSTDDSLSDSSSEQSFKKNSKNKQSKPMKKIKKIKESSDEEDSSESISDSSSVASSNIIESNKKFSSSNGLKEKKEIIYQLDRLEARGYSIPFKFNLNSNLEEMRLEYNKIIREKEIDGSIRFQRKMMMAFVTGSEYLNSRYDPFAIKLEGWSEQVHDNINDYDDIFEELHDKYKSSGKKMSPELRLFISLSGSAFMFHLTSRMFKETPLPNVENVLRSNPDLMKKFQEAAAKEYVLGNNGNSNTKNNNSINNSNNNGPGLFGMVSNLFNNMGGGSMQNNMQYDMDNNSERNYNSNNDIDSIINDVHKNISLEQDNNNIETLSVSDEEITSIIEDTADIKILRNNNKNNKKRTLNI